MKISYSGQASIAEQSNPSCHDDNIWGSAPYLKQHTSHVGSKVAYLLTRIVS